VVRFYDPSLYKREVRFYDPSLYKREVRFYDPSLYKREVRWDFKIDCWKIPPGSLRSPTPFNKGGDQVIVYWLWIK